MNTIPEILVYQMGKVGSSTIHSSLNHLGIPNRQVHFLSWGEIRRVEQYFLDYAHARIPAHIQESRKLRSAIDHNRGSMRWKVITLVRDPVSRDISDVFENLPNILPSIINQPEEHRFEMIRNWLIDEYREAADHINTYVGNWFDKEIKEVFCLDIYTDEFRKEKGYHIYKTDDADILLLKLELLSKCSEQAFKEFLRIDHFQLINTNIGKQKPYYDLYQNFLRYISIPDELLDIIYASRYVQHFYTEDEIDSYKNKWSDNG